MYNAPNIHIPPGIYTVKDISSKDKVDYTLEFYTAKFKTPNRVYGDTVENVNRVWNAFYRGNNSSGVILLGDGGSGKTLFAELLANIGIAHNYAVVMVNNIAFTEELLYMLAGMDNIILLLDEFGKNISTAGQNKALNILSDNTKKRLYIITENEHRDISRFILDRPGRIRYRLDYSKVSRKVIDDYIKDHPVTNTFYNDFISIWNKAKVLTYDHMSCLVTEHIQYPNDSLEHLLEILNLNILKPVQNIVLYKVVDTSGTEYDWLVRSRDVINFKLIMLKEELNNRWNPLVESQMRLLAKGDKEHTKEEISQSGINIPYIATMPWRRDEETGSYIATIDMFEFYFMDAD